MKPLSWEDAGTFAWADKGPEGDGVEGAYYTIRDHDAHGDYELYIVDGVDTGSEGEGDIGIFMTKELAQEAAQDHHNKRNKK